MKEMFYLRLCPASVGTNVKGTVLAMTLVSVFRSVFVWGSVCKPTLAGPERMYNWSASDIFWLMHSVTRQPVCGVIFLLKR